MAETSGALLWYDYLIFVAMVSISIAIGIYYGCYKNRQNQISVYLFGDKKLSPLPVGLSVAVGHFSAITILCVPADTYKYGAFWLLTNISFMLVTLVATTIFLPVFFSLRLNTVYEYLDQRFGKKVKLLAAILFVLEEALYLPVVIYTPALALSTVTNIPPTLASVIMSAICVFYTTIGGLRAVIGTDLFQLLIIVLLLLLMGIIGTGQEGGLVEVFQKASAGGRFDIFDFDLDPTKHDSVWIYVIGYTSFWIGMSVKQAAAQKFLALPTFRASVWSFICFTTSICVVFSSCVYIGLLIYSKYENCDPQGSQRITRHEEILPLYIMDLAGDIPGVSGLFLVALFCAALSTISCHLNAVATVLYQDILSKFWTLDQTSARTVKVIVALIGTVCTILTLLVEHLGDVLPLILSLQAVSNGPLLGMFTLGVLVPRSNTKGIFYGAVTGFLLTAGLVVPSKFVTFTHPTRTLSVAGCESLENYTSVNQSSSVLPPAFMRVSPFYHATVGAVVTIVVGLIVSYATSQDGVPMGPVKQSLLDERPNDRNTQELQTVADDESKIFEN